MSLCYLSNHNSIMNVNPSTEWRPEERLQIIVEHVAHAMNNNLINNPHATAEIMDIISIVATHPPDFLEKNRSGILRLPYCPGILKLP